MNLIDILNLNTELWIIHSSVKSLHREVVHFLLSIIFIHEEVVVFQPKGPKLTSQWHDKSQQTKIYIFVIFQILIGWH